MARGYRGRIRYERKEKMGGLQGVEITIQLAMKGKQGPRSMHYVFYRPLRMMLAAFTIHAKSINLFIF